MSEWQPAVARAFHPQDWPGVDGAQIRVRENASLPASKRCSGKRFEVHPDDVKRFRPDLFEEDTPVGICEHEILTD